MHGTRFLAPSHLATTLLLPLLLVAAARAQSADSPPAAFGESEYRLGPEDVVQVWIWKELDSSVTAMVRPDGKVSLPLVGEVQARGKTVGELQAEIADRMRAYIADPVVTVIVTEINSPQISVLGKVEKPDLYKIRQRITVLDAIAMAGGFTEFAKRDKVIIIRNNSPRQQILRVDLKRPDKIDGAAFYLQPSDIVYVQ